MINGVPYATIVWSIGIGVTAALLVGFPWVLVYLNNNLKPHAEDHCPNTHGLAVATIVRTLCFIVIAGFVSQNIFGMLKIEVPPSIVKLVDICIGALISSVMQTRSDPPPSNKPIDVTVKNKKKDPIPVTEEP